MMTPAASLSVVALLLASGFARAQDLPIQLGPGKTSLPPDLLLQDLESLLGRDVRFVEAISPEGEAVWLEPTGDGQIDVRCRDASGTTRSRILSISGRPFDVAHEVALLVVELLAPSSASPPGPPEQGGEIEGVVRGSAGEGIAEAKLVLSGTNGVAVQSTDTDQAGRFRLPDVPPGTYRLEVTADGLAPLTHPLTIDGDVHDLALTLAPLGGVSYRTVTQATRAPLPTQDGTSTTVITREDIHELPGGTTLPLNSVLETTPGWSPDSFGAVHLRGNYTSPQLRIDGIQLPPAIQDRLQQLVESQIVDHVDVIIGGLPAEYGEDVSGVVDITTRRATGPWEGDATIAYGSYATAELVANAAGNVGPVNAVIAGSLHSSARGLDPPAVTPILNDQLYEGHLFLRLEDKLSASDRVELLSVYADSHYDVPIDPTILPLSAGPANAQRGFDQFGNTAPDFVPYNSNPTEIERESFTAVSWFHKFNDRAELQIAPFGRYQQSNLSCDTVNQLGPTADPGTTCTNVNHQVVQGGLQANQTLGIGNNDLKAGLLVDYQRSSVAFTVFTRDDSDPQGGVDPTQTVAGEDDIDTLLVGAYVQDKIKLGKLTLSPGVRVDVMRAAEEGPGGGSSNLFGPSLRLGAAYAFSDTWVLHAYVGNLWQPPSFDAPAAARILHLIPADAPVPFDLTYELDYYGELGLTARVIPQLTLSVVAWGRYSDHTVDDNDVGDTALTADYNYQHGRAAGAEFWAKLALGKHFHAFANFTAMVTQGEGIGTSLYLFTPAQLNFQGYQSVDNAQPWGVNAGFDLSDSKNETHLSGLMTAGGGVVTGAINQYDLPANCTFNATLRHSFAELPLKPEVALDVTNIFNVVYAYRISTGNLAGSAYAPLREVMVRLIVPFGS